MARKKKSPLYASILDDNIIVEPGPKDTKNTTIGEDGTITYKDTKNTDGGSILGGEDIMEAYRDKVHSLDATAVSPGPKEIDTSGIDKQIAAVEKPTGKSVWDKQAAYYRQQGEGQVLRNQKDLAALTQPTITLYGERIAASNAKYELLKEQMPEFDSSNIFGEEGPNKIPMPIIGEIKNISKSVKADMRELSRLNINDPRYDELRNKMEKDQQLIVEFDNINQQLIKIRNDKESNGSESDNWSKQMSEEEQRMWQDIYTGNAKNIKIIDGKLQWADPGGASYEFKGGSFEDDKYKALGGEDDSVLGNLAYYTRDKNGEQYTFENGEKNEDVMMVQEVLIKGGFTDADGNELDIDGEWGPKSQAAYDKYLEQKDELETAWLNENLSEEQKEKYKEEGIMSIKGKGAIRDLSKIGDEPTLRSAKAQKASFSMQNFMYNAIEKGANATGNAAAKSLYNEALGDVEFMYDKLNTREQASLLFDGMDEKDTRSVNTNDFVNSILEKNDMELSDLIEGGMLESYTDPETGKEMPLRQMFKNWYLDELYERTKPLTPTNITGGGSGSSSGSGSNLTNSGVNLTYGVRGSAEVSYGNKTINGYDLQDGEIGITGVDLKSIVKKITAADGSSLKEHTSEVPDDKNYIITKDDVLMKYDEDAEDWIPSDFNVDSSNPNSVDTYNAIMKNIKKKIEKEGGTFDYVKGTSFSYIKSRKDEIDIVSGGDNFTNDFYTKELSNPDNTYKDIIDLYVGNGETLADDFNKKYEKYGFHAVVNDDNPKLKLSPDVMAGTFASERDGEGVLRIYYRKPNEGTVLDGFSGHKYTYSATDYNGSGSYIDVLHDSWSPGRKNQNLEYLIEFMNSMHGQSDVQDYWNEEVKYTSKGNEVTSDQADEITY